MRMLEVDVDRRYTAAEALNDPWLANMMKLWKVDEGLAYLALDNLRTFRAQRKLQQACWMYITTHMLTQENREKLMQIFEALDVDGDGLIEKDELIQGYMKVMGQVYSQEELDKIIKEVDVNQSGVIDYSEFVMATISRQISLSNQMLEAAFAMLDKDGKGYLDANDLKVVLNAHGKKIQESVWSDMIREADLDKDGKISIDEFKNLMKSGMSATYQQAPVYGNYVWSASAGNYVRSNQAGNYVGNNPVGNYVGNNQIEKGNNQIGNNMPRVS